MAISKTTKGKGRNFRSTEEGAGMTSKGVKAYRKANPGSKLKTAVTGDVKKGSKAAKRRKAFCARSKSWKGERGLAARKRLADSIPGGCGCKNRQNILNDYFPYKNK